MVDNVFQNGQNILLTLLGLVFLVVALRVGASSNKADYAKTAKTGFNVGVAMVIAAIGAGVLVVVKFGTDVLKAIGVL